MTGDCTDACNGATSVVATVTVGSWPTDIGPIFTTASGALQLPALPGRPRLRQRDGDAHSVSKPDRGSGGGGVRGLREHGRRDPGRRLGGVRLAGRIHTFRQTFRSCSTLRRLRVRSEPPPAGRKRSLRLSDLQAQLPVVVRSAAARIARVVVETRGLQRGSKGSSRLSSPVRGEMAGARPKRSDPPCIYPSGHVDWFSAASCWWPDLQPQCSSRRLPRGQSRLPPRFDRPSVTSTA